MNQRPLVVDLDGTLLRSDLLLETSIAFIRQQPFQLWKPFQWLSHGKATLKEGLAQAVDFDVSVLPYDPEVIAFIEKERALGREIILATASHSSLAKQVAEHLGLFDDVIASNSTLNLAAENKRDCLIERYGEQGFDYMGNSTDDLCVWQVAQQAHVVNASSQVEQRAKAHGNVAEVIHSNPSNWKTWLKAMRLHQWLKNALIFVPLLAAHQLFKLDAFFIGLIAFFLFGLCASSVYLLNDILDLADDRHHASKRNRPFASGKLSIRDGLIAFPLLLASAFALAICFLPWPFVGALAGYYALTLAYSLFLKRYMAVDVIALAMLYTMRIIAGAAALALPLTFWILAFSMFIFLSLALVKRYAELLEARNKGEHEQTRGRGYYPVDLEMISSLGAASGYLSVMVLALYIYDQSTVQLYQYAHIIWLACPLLLFWITRIWMLTHRGAMHEDPVVFASHDRTSLIVGALFLLTFWVAI